MPAPSQRLEPLPVGFGLELDADARELRPGLWFGGRPARALRLTEAGREAWLELRDGAAVSTSAGGRLARQLTDAGLAHPVPPVTDVDLTVVIPVHERAGELDRCLAALGAAWPVIVVDDASRDERQVRSVAASYGARIVRLPVNSGPAAARNAGLAHVDTELVAFVDSDTAPSAEALSRVAAHLADPAVAAAAPRIVAAAGRSWSARYTAARGSLDLGVRPAGVARYGAVSYLPTAALVARRSALLALPGDVFDPALRVGEDVDLVWRLIDAGWRVRYDPTVQVQHEDPKSWPGLLRRRFRYGTSAAPLSVRHRDSVAHLVVAPWYAATVGALLARRPVLSVAGLAGASITTYRSLHRLDVPTGRVLAVVAGGVGQTWLGAARCAGQFGAPALIAALLRGSPGARLVAASLLLGPSLLGWSAQRPGLGPVRYTAGAVADEFAYGAGVLAGCITHRTARPLRPLVVASSSRRS